MFTDHKADRVTEDQLNHVMWEMSSAAIERNSFGK
jgi:hypothetical protein